MASINYATAGMRLPDPYAVNPLREKRAAHVSTPVDQANARAAKAEDEAAKLRGQLDKARQTIARLKSAKGVR